MRIDNIIGKIAPALVLGTFLVVPLGAWFYDGVYLPSQYPEGAKVFTLYWSASKGITQERINGWNYWQARFNRVEEIRVRQWDRVVFRLISADTHHGFALPVFGITDAVIKPGDITTVEFIADKAGSFKFYCTIRCGPMHEKLEAVLTVQPADRPQTQ